jgi:hypothetical protein
MTLSINPYLESGFKLLHIGTYIFACNLVILIAINNRDVNICTRARSQNMKLSGSAPLNTRVIYMCKQC